MRRLGEAVLRAVGTPELRRTPQYEMALRFLREGVLPNGQGYADGPPRFVVTLGDAESCELQRVRRAQGSDGVTQVEARFWVHPSRAGGAGVSIDGAITEFFMSYAEPEPCDDSAKMQLGAALRVVAEERATAVREAIGQLLTPDDLLWRLVGWGQRDRWVQEEATVARVALGDAWVEEIRGETWLAKHWECWLPITLDVSARLRRK